MKRIFFVFSLILFLMVSCSKGQNIETTRILAIEELENYSYDGLNQGSYRKYALESILEIYKEEINNSKEKTEIYSLNLSAKKDIDNIILTNAEISNIKSAFLESKKDYNMGSGFPEYEFGINHLLWKSASKYILILNQDVDTSLHADVVSSEYYGYYVVWENKLHYFYYLPELISVVYNDKYYTLSEAREEKIVTDEELAFVWKTYYKIFLDLKENGHYFYEFNK